MGPRISLESCCSDEPQFLLLVGICPPLSEKGQGKNGEPPAAFIAILSVSLCSEFHFGKCTLGFFSGSTGEIVLTLN